MHIVDIRKLNPQHLSIFEELLWLFNQVFEEGLESLPDHAYLEQLLANPGFHVFTAMEGSKVVGGITAYEMPGYYRAKPELYIYDMAVAVALHNRGIGKQLIAALKAFAATRNINTIFVEAHTEDEQAVKFYQSTFDEAEDVKHFNLYL
jgi:aminoglycoside 3-N-acetyltransferase I